MRIPNRFTAVLGIVSLLFTYVDLPGQQPAYTPHRKPIWTEQALSPAAHWIGHPWVAKGAAWVRTSGEAARRMWRDSGTWLPPLFGWAVLQDDTLDRQVEELSGVLEQFVIRAGRTLREERANAKLTQQTKADGSVVTALDYRLERELFETVLDDPRFADVYIDAEERFQDAGVRPDLIDRNRVNFGIASIVISLDPLDGTRIYATTEDPFYSACAVLLVNGHPVRVFVNAPEEGQHFRADVPEGTLFINGTQIDPKDLPVIGTGNKILAGGLRWSKPPHPLADVLPKFYTMVDRFMSIALAVSRFVTGNPSHGFDGAVVMGMATNDTLPTAALLQARGLQVARADGSPFFPVRWSDLAEPARGASNYIAGDSRFVETVVELNRKAAPADVAAANPAIVPDASGWELLDDSLVQAALRSRPIEVVRDVLKNLNPGYPLQKLLNTPLWNRLYYHRKNLPSVVGELTPDQQKSFTIPQGIRIQDMPIHMPGQGWKIVKFLEPSLPAIQIALETQKAINPEFNEEDWFCFVTLDQKDVGPNQTQRRSGAHGDGFLNEDNADFSRDILTEITYVVTDNLPTVFFPGPFNLDGVDLNDIPAVLANFDKTAQEQRNQWVHYKPYQVIRLTPYDVHSPSVNESDQIQHRTFLKITFSQEKFNRLGNARNPHFDYQNWSWVPRTANVRNLRYKHTDQERSDKAEFQLVQPRWLDPLQDTVDADWAKPAEESGKPNVFWAQKKKSAWVKAEMSEEERFLELREGHEIRSYMIASRGDWIITKGSQQYPLSRKQFESRYEPVPDHPGSYQPKPHPVRMVEITKRIRYRAPWSGWHYAEPGDVMVWLSPTDMYVIHRANFDAEYEPIASPKTAPSGPAHGSGLAEGLESVSGQSLRPDAESPLIAVMDLHGVLLDPTWRVEYAYARQKLAGGTMEEARRWVEQEAVGFEDAEIFQKLARELKMPFARIQEVFTASKRYLQERSNPRAMAGALEFVKGLREQGVDIIVISGSPTQTIRRQLEMRGFGEYIRPEHIIGKDAVQRMSGGGVFRDRAIEAVAQQFPEHRILYFNDWVGSFDLIKRLGGRIFALPQGVDAEHDNYRKILIQKGADFLLDGWKAASWLIENLAISRTQQEEARRKTLPTADHPARELPFLVASSLTPKKSLWIEVEHDLSRLYYSVKEGHLPLRPLWNFASLCLISPLRFIRHFAVEPIRSEILELWNQNRRITVFRGIETNWDKEVDRDVWAFNVDTGYLHATEEEADLYNRITIRSAAEIGSGGGHGVKALLQRIPDLKELTFTDISPHALAATLRNVWEVFLSSIVKLHPYKGRGIRTLSGGYDYIKVNPPYIPTLPGDAEGEDAFRGTELIREVFEFGAAKLNPFNPEASVVINISSLAKKDWDAYNAQFGGQWIIEELGEPRTVPLKIGAIANNPAWLRYLIDEHGLVEKKNPQPWEEPYEHTLQVYRLRPKANVPEVLNDEIQSYQAIVDRVSAPEGPACQWVGTSGPKPGARRVGIFGITANPVHNAHVQVVESALKEGIVDEVVVVLARDHVSKPPSPNDASYAERLAMIQRAFQGHPKVHLMFSRSGRYLDYLRQWQAVDPSSQPVFLLGTDSLQTMANHNSPADFLEFATAKSEFVVSPRYGDEQQMRRIWSEDPNRWPESFTERVHFRRVELPAASSNLVRVLCGDADLLYRELVPQTVAHIIELRNLYRQPAAGEVRATAFREYFEWVAEKFRTLKLARMDQWLAQWPPQNETPDREREILWNDGVNRTVDALLTRINPETGKREYLRGLRKKNRKWALPGGFIDPGEDDLTAVVRELGEEANLTLSLRTAMRVYKGRVDDSRNSKRRWIETTVFWYELSDEEAMNLQPIAGDDLEAVEWCPLDEDHIQGLHANHTDILRVTMAHIARGELPQPSTPRDARGGSILRRPAKPVGLAA